MTPARPGILKRTLDRLTGGQAEPSEPTVAAFGKHPGWDDHVSPIGLDRPVLETFHRLLYLEGLKGNIDGGAWPEDHGSDRLHLRVLFRNAEGRVLARVWPSVDGRGRRRFPMVACAAAARGEVLPLTETDAILQTLEARSRDAQEASSVERSVAAASLALREAVTAPGPEDARLPAESEVLAALDADAPASDHPDALLRVLYQLDRDLVAYRPANGRGTSTWAGKGDLGPKHVRVPRCGQDASEGLRRWSAFLEQELASRVPFWVVAPVDHDVVDLLVGAVSRSELYCLGADDIVPASEIPYEMDDAVRARLSARLGRTRKNASSDDAPEKSSGC